MSYIGSNLLNRSRDIVQRPQHKVMVYMQTPGWNERSCYPLNLHLHHVIVGLHRSDDARFGKTTARLDE